jgi:hypothetical protein
MRVRARVVLASALCLGGCADLWGFGDVTVGADGGAMADGTAGDGSDAASPEQDAQEAGSTSESGSDSAASEPMEASPTALEDGPDATGSDADVNPTADGPAGMDAGCSVDTLACNGQQPTICTGSGAWQAVGAPCVGQACVNGACTGVCAPNSTECSSSTQIQTCTSSGQWGNAVAACSGTSTVCSGGDCVPGPLCCNGLFPPPAGGSPAVQSLTGGYYWYGPTGAAKAPGMTCGTASEGTCYENTSGCTGTIGYCYDAG